MACVPAFLARRRGRSIALSALILSCASALALGDGVLGAEWLLWGLPGGLAAAWLALAAHRAWFFPPVLMRAERLWASGAPVAEVLAVSGPLALALGEVGYRAMMLRSWAHFAAGRPGPAAESAFAAHSARMPLWARAPLRVCAKLMARGWRAPEALLVRLAPEAPMACWLRLERMEAAKCAGKGAERDAESDRLGWELLLDCAQSSPDDPLFLDACLRRALGRLEVNMDGRAAPLSGPEARALLELSMTLLLRRHNDPRLPWDRAGLAAHLQREGRSEAVLALCGGLPPAHRTPDLWLLEARAWGRLGDVGSARATIDAAVRVHPASHPLWMEAYRIAMARKDGAAARRSLDRARKCMGAAGDGPGRWEYELAKSEYFYWVEGRADAAMAHLSRVPGAYAESRRPRFAALMLLSKGDFEGAYAKISDLLKAAPNDIDLMLMQSEAMAGMGAWEALLPHLDSMGDDARERAAYWHLRGLAGKCLSDHGRAREDLERAAWMDSSNIRFVLAAGGACIDLGEHERSEQHWRRALRLDPHNGGALLRLAESRELQGDAAAAKSLLRECLVHHPDSAAAQEMLARLDTN
jgi:tetratricopeptide (TPR) repeat protein